METKAEQSRQDREAFRIENIDQASWAFRKLAQTRSKMAQNEALAGREVERIKNWLAAENESLRYDEAYFEGLIREYQTRVEKEDPKAKVSTPYGKVKKRTAKRWIWGSGVLDSLKAQGMNQFVRTKTEEVVDKNAIKKAATVTPEGFVVLETGELLEGVMAQEEMTYTFEATEGGIADE